MNGSSSTRTQFDRGRTAALALLLIFFSTLAVAAPSEPDASALVAEHAKISAERQQIIATMKGNLAQKRSIEQEYKAVDADTERYRRDVSEATAFCTGRFEDEEYRRRKELCERMQRELDRRHEELEARRKDIERRDKARQAAAVKLKASYDALGERAKTIENSISDASPFAGVADRCRKEQKDADAIDQCIDRGWAEAAEEVRDYVNLETGDAFTQGNQWREEIYAMPWSQRDQLQAALAVLLADTGRYGDAASLLGALEGRLHRDPFLVPAKAALQRLAEKQADHPAATQAGRNIAEQLNITHLSPAAQAGVLLGILLFRQGDYRGAIDKFNDAQKRHPADPGLKDLSFLVAQVAAASAAPAAGAGQPRIARIMQREGALAAEALALHLMECGDAVQAELALNVTRERLSNALKASPSPAAVDRASLDGINALIAQVRAQGTAGVAIPPGQRYFDGRSKADLMLDAISYGQKSWGSSLRYLELAKAADPGNARIRQAYDELAAIARKVASP